MFEMITNFGVVLARILAERFGHQSSDVVVAVELFAALVAEGEDAKEELAELNAEIEQMIESGVGLTSARIAEFRARRAELSGDISAIRDQREAEEAQKKADQEKADADAKAKANAAPKGNAKK